MPAPVLSDLAAQAGVSLDRAEDLWTQAKAAAKDQGHDEDYAYIVGILKKMLGLTTESHVLGILNQIDTSIAGGVHV